MALGDPIFVTGGGGFVGRALLPHLFEAGADEVTFLARNTARFRSGVTVRSGWRVLEGDLKTPGSWETELPEGGTVLHMAAVTGKARAREYDADRCSFGGLLVLDDSTRKLELGPADIARLEELYDAQIRQLDAELARLFTSLRKAGIFDETLLIITSDHGEEFMEHGRVDHFVPR